MSQFVLRYLEQLGTCEPKAESALRQQKSQILDLQLERILDLLTYIIWVQLCRSLSVPMSLVHEISYPHTCKNRQTFLRAQQMAY